MQTNFDEIVPRRGSHSYKWDTSVQDSVIPLWVADMDFPTAPSIVEALTKRVQHGIFGYTKVPESYFEAIQHWFSMRHNWLIDRSSILYTTGVVPALSAIVTACTSPGDRVLVQTPVYNCFFSSIRNMGCEVVSNELIADEKGSYSMNFEDLETKTADPRVKLLLLCNPHNPVGRVWTREELQRLGEICLKNKVLVVSDEIHCDLIYKGATHLPYALLGEEYAKNSITCIAPSKTFNLAGLQVANIVAKDETLRRKIDKALNIHEVCEINPFAVEALIAAYTDERSVQWLDELIPYLWGNYQLVKTFFAENAPPCVVSPLQATYLVWIKCSPNGTTGQELRERLIQDAGVWLNEGEMYGAAGSGYLRMNIACPRPMLVKALSQMLESSVFK